ncbi:hypothetical protein PENSPDRAFT_652556 [Peniophora sp. CONT]|nr:hypothetical protein PENSPDRAFT_652556 [Peniophora sp. CONT]
MSEQPHHIETAVTTLQANRAYRNGLRSHIEQMKEELAGLDEMIELAERDEDEFQADVSGSIMIPGQRKVVGIGLIPPSEIAKAGSPFHSDVNRVQRYKLSAEVHAMRTSELELLAKGVRNENIRLQTLSGTAVTVSPDDPSLEENSEGLDWDRIRSLVVSDLGSFALRTPEELRVRWVATEHPKMNHGAWPAEELKRAKELVDQTPKGQTVNWVDVAQKLGTNRLPLDIMRHTVKRKTHRNDKESDERLAKAVELYGSDNWQLVARQVSEDATAENVEKRWINTVNPARPTGPWTAEEDEQLQRAVAVFDQQWAQIAPFMGGRTAGQCRDHFEDGLKPTLKKDLWVPEELEQLRALVGELGNKWTEISKRLEGRSDAQCRRAWDRLQHGELPGQKRKKAQQSMPDVDPSLGDDAAPPPAKAPKKPKGKKKSAPPQAPTAESDSIGAQEGEAGPSYTPSRPKPKPKAVRKAKTGSTATTIPDASEAAGSADHTPAPAEKQHPEESTDEANAEALTSAPKKRQAKTTAATVSRSTSTKRKAGAPSASAQPKPTTSPTRRQPARSARSSTRANDDA